MNKSQLIDEVAEQAGLSKTEAAKAVEAFVDHIGAALASGDDVRLVGFGTFSTSERVARAGRNPQTGEPIEIRASTLPKFRAGSVLKDSVRHYAPGGGRTGGTGPDD